VEGQREQDVAVSRLRDGAGQWYHGRQGGLQFRSGWRTLKRDGGRRAVDRSLSAWPGREEERDGGAREEARGGVTR
jgi:hypothetical protein